MRAPRRAAPRLVQYSRIDDGETDAADQLRRNQTRQELVRLQNQEHKTHGSARIFDYHVECVICEAIRESQERKRKFDAIVQKRVAEEVQRQMRDARWRRRNGPQQTQHIAQPTNPQANLCHTFNAQDEDGGPSRTVGVCFGADAQVRSVKLMSSKPKPTGKHVAKLG